MLVAVIGLFVVCVTPDAIMSTVFGLGYYDEDYLVRSIREITDFLLTVNSAWNFVLYCAFNTVFRNRFRALITAGCRRRRRSSGGGETSRRRRTGGSALPAAEVDVPASQRVSENNIPRAARCSVVVGTNGQCVIIICSDSGGNMLELNSDGNHEALVLTDRPVTM